MSENQPLLFREKAFVPNQKVKGDWILYTSDSIQYLTEKILTNINAYLYDVKKLYHPKITSWESSPAEGGTVLVSVDVQGEDYSSLTPEGFKAIENLYDNQGVWCSNNDSNK